MRVKQPPQIKDYTCVGVLTGAHGILGDVKFKPFVDDIDALQHKEAQVINSQHETITIQHIKRVGGGKLALKTAQITDRNAAEDSMGTFLYILRKKLSKTLIDQDYLSLEVVLNKKAVGQVENVFDNGAHLILEVQTIENTEVLIPVAEQFVLKTTKTQIILTEDAQAFFEL